MATQARRQTVLAGLLVLLPGLAQAEMISVTSAPVPLSEADATLVRVGALEYRGGLRLTSPDRRFGGLSGLHVSDDGQTLTAIGDEGTWFVTRLLYDADARLVGVGGAELGPLHGPDGEALAVKEAQDAESLARLPDGAWLVGFEHWHRMWAYRGGEHPLEQSRPTSFTSPPGLEAAPANGSLESLAALPDGRLVALTEELREADRTVGWLGRDGHWEKILYRTDATVAPSDATALPSGDLLVLERGYSPVSGSTIRVRLVPAGELGAGATLEGRLLAELKRPLTVDNFEGIATRVSDKGETLVYLISDDNFNPMQRTLLLMFALDTTAAR